MKSWLSLLKDVKTAAVGKSDTRYMHIILHTHRKVSLVHCTFKKQNREIKAVSFPTTSASGETEKEHLLLVVASVLKPAMEISVNSSEKVFQTLPRAMFLKQCMTPFRSGLALTLVALGVSAT